MTPAELEKAGKLRNTAFIDPQRISNRTDIAKYGAGATAKAGLGVSALSNPVSALGTAGISGGLGYAGARLTGQKNPLYQAGLSAGQSLPYAGINKFTGPIQNTVVNTLLPGVTNPLTRGIVKGGVQATGNVFEDLLLTPILQGRMANRGELAISAGTGVLSGVGGEYAGATLKKIKDSIRKVNPQINEKQIDSVAKQFVRDELGRFSRQGYEPPKTKFVKDAMITDSQRMAIRKELGLPEDVTIPIGFQAKPLSESGRAKMRAEFGEEAINPKLKVGGGEFGTERFNTSSTINTTIRDVAKRLEPQISEARGGTKSFEQTLSDAKQISLDDLLSGKGKHAQDAKVFAASSYIKEFSEKVDSLRKFGGNITSQQKAELEFAQDNLDKLVIKTFGEISPESGRALKAHQYLAEVISDPQLTLKNMVVRNPDIYPQSEAVLKGLNQFDPSDKIGMIKYLRDAQKVSNVSKLESLWYNNILSAPATHIANGIGNLGRTAWHLATKPFRVAVDTVGSKITGEPREEFLRETMPEIVGATKGFRDGVRRAVFAFKNGLRESDVSELNVPTAGFKGKLQALETPSRLLLAGDELFRGINRNMEIYRQATSKAVKEGLRGEAFNTRVAELIDSPTPDMLKNADELASKLLFQDASKELSAVGGLRDFAKFDIPKIGTVKPMRFVIPFIQTPVNVAKFAIEASPLGFAQTAVQAGKSTKQEMNRRLASNILGTALTTSLATYFVEGSLTARAPKNPKDADAFYAEGKLPYSVKIGDTWVQYNRLPEPLASTLTNLALIHEEFKNNPDANITDKVSSYTSGFLRSMADRTFLQGIGDLMDAIEDPERYGKRFGQNLAVGFIPGSSALGAVARATDRTVRQPENLSQTLQSRIPGLSKNVPAKSSAIEPGGEAIRKTPAWQEFIPVKTSKEKPLTLDQIPQMSSKGIVERISTLSREDKLKVLATVKKDNPVLFAQVKRGILDQKQGVTPEEVKLRNSSIFERATKINKLLQTGTKEEKMAVLEDMKNKGILTDSVIKELKRIKSSNE